ncbi:exosortase/archaeosortase family protein [archaeon]|nr:exosortase/archaeosortase family protein [archaeon]
MLTFFKKIKRDLKTKKKIKESLYFLLFFIISFSLIYLLLSKTLIYNFINYFYGSLSSIILNIFYGINTSFYYDFIEQVTFLIIPSIDYPVAIVFLCTGILEFSLIVSAIVSTIGFSLRKKIKWVLISSFLVIIFNLLRITFTIFIIDYFNLEIADFFHGFLFRLFLVIIVIGTYYFFLKS